MALAAAEARAAAAEEELEVLRDALAASAPSNASNDNDLIKALERERDAALDACGVSPLLFSLARFA